MSDRAKAKLIGFIGLLLVFVCVILSVLDTETSYAVPIIILLLVAAWLLIWSVCWIIHMDDHDDDIM